ncbi:ATP-binding protein [Fluviibacterium sp. DFM31]|uniref:ATP-binding protein n=1 Tax=Meridianimarinicoccus marinus TaxID=3231483 RepID=A0ABV3L7C4_9RHOB
MTGYTRARDYLGDALALLALRLQREVSILRALRRPGRNESFLGLFLSEDDAESLLRELTGEVIAENLDIDATISAAEAAIAERLAATERMLPAAHLCGVFGLSVTEFELLLAAAAPAIDDRFGRVYGFLHDDMGRRGFTLTIAQHLMAPQGIDMPALRQMLAPLSPLRRNALLRAPGQGPLSALPMTVDEEIVDLLLDTPRARSCHPDLPPLARPAWVGMTPELAVAGELTRPVTVDLSEGGDAGAVAAALADPQWSGVRVIDWRRWSARPDADVPGLLATSLRDARIDDHLPLLIGFDAAPPAVQAAVATLLDGPAVVTSATALHWYGAGLASVEVTPPPLSPAARRAVWESVLTDTDLAAEMAASYDLPATEVAELADHVARQGGVAAQLRQAARRRAGQPMQGIAERVETPFGFGDLVLDGAALQQLHDFAETRRQRARVLSDWGLGPAFGKGTGTTALFVGPSGTGKTMAASVIANRLGLDLYRVDLAGVVSKYIGETEKNLDRVFEAADRADVVLFFDEADALFGKRSEVSDAHDRYANIEVSYLLQRMESFRGAAILATNLGQNLDEAFLRRIDMVIEFQAPGTADRLRLWQRLQETAAPMAQDLDLALLAERFELTGGEIRNCCLAAAHMAAAEGAAISMRHAMRAVGREYVKNGRPLRRAIFGEFYSELRAVGGPGA